MQQACFLIRIQLVTLGQLNSIAHCASPHLIRTENRLILKPQAHSSNVFVRPNEVKFVTQWSGRDTPLFNPSCILDTPWSEKGDGLCITRYGGTCFEPKSARKPRLEQNGRRLPAYGLANYSFGATGHQIEFRPIAIPENVSCGLNDGHPRWFYLDRKLYVISWSEGCSDTRHERVPVSRQRTWEMNQFKNYIWEFGTNKTTFLSWDGFIEKDRKNEEARKNAKNFLPFQYKDRLLTIVTVKPHRVFEINVSDGNMTPFAETPARISYTDVGLSAGPIVLDEQRFLVAAHMYGDQTAESRRMFFYTCQAFPPFEILEESPPFYFTGDAPQHHGSLIDLAKNLTERSQSPRRIEYGMQMQHHGNELMLSLGIDDCDAAVITVPLSAVTSQLNPLGVSIYRW